MSKIDLSNYIPVNERLEKFYKDFRHGRVATEIIEHDRESGFVMVKASIYRLPEDAEPSATGHAFEERAVGYVNKTSYIENCETSAVGRALALLGYEISKGIASREEMQKVERYEQSGGQKPQSQKPQPQNAPTTINQPNAPASEKQIGALRNICRSKNLSEIDVCLEYSNNEVEIFDNLTKAQASEAISQLGGGGK